MRRYSFVMTLLALLSPAMVSFAAQPCKSGSTHHYEHSGCNYVAYCLRAHVAYSDDIPMPGWPDRRAARMESLWNEYKQALNICSLDYYQYFRLSRPPTSTTPTPKQEQASPSTTRSMTPRVAEPPEEKVNVDPDPDWAGATRERILKGKKGNVVSVNQNPKRIAPYGSADCAEIKPAPNRGKIDWDFVTIRNKCSYPIQALVCYYDQGRGADCVAKKGARGWGLSDLLSPGEKQTSVATSTKLPWFARIIVCDMREKSDLLCVLPN